MDAKKREQWTFNLEMWNISATFKIFATKPRGLRASEWGGWKEDSSVYELRNKGLETSEDSAQTQWCLPGSVQRQGSGLAQTSIHLMTVCIRTLWYTLVISKDTILQPRTFQTPLNIWGTLRREQYQVYSWRIHHRNQVPLSIDTEDSQHVRCSWELSCSTLEKFLLPYLSPSVKKQTRCWLVCAVPWNSNWNPRLRNTLTHYGQWRPGSVSSVQDTAIFLVLFKRLHLCVNAWGDSTGLLCYV